MRGPTSKGKGEGGKGRDRREGEGEEGKGRRERGEEGKGRRGKGFAPPQADRLDPPLPSPSSVGRGTPLRTPLPPQRLDPCACGARPRRLILPPHMQL